MTKKAELQKLAHMVMNIDHAGVQFDNIHKCEEKHQAILALDKLDKCEELAEKIGCKDICVKIDTTEHYEYFDLKNKGGTSSIALGNNSINCKGVDNTTNIEPVTTTSKNDANTVLSAVLLDQLDKWISDCQLQADVFFERGGENFRNKFIGNEGRLYEC